MALPCTGVVGTFQYSAPTCKKQQKEGDTATSDDGHPAVTREPVDEDPQARCRKKGDKPDELEDICPKCNDEIVWVRKRIDVSNVNIMNTGNNTFLSHITIIIIMYYLRQGGYVFLALCVPVCVSVCKMSPKVTNGFWWNFLERWGAAQALAKVCALTNAL